MGMKHIFDLRQCESIRQQYESGASTASLSAQYFSSKQTIRMAVLRAGGIMSHKGKRKSKIKDTDKLIIEQLLASGLPVMEIGRRYSVQSSTIAYFAKKWGIVYTPLKRGRPLHATKSQIL